MFDPWRLIVCAVFLAVVGGLLTPALKSMRPDDTTTVAWSRPSPGNVEVRPRVEAWTQRSRR